jgi:hypothetical protein
MLWLADSSSSPGNDTYLSIVSLAISSPFTVEFRKDRVPERYGDAERFSLSNSLQTALV